MEATAHASATVSRLMPSSPPRTARSATRKLFQRLHELASEEIPETPDAIDAMLQRWAALEEQYQVSARAARHWEKLSGSGGKLELQVDPTAHGWEAWAPTSPLRNLRHSLSRSLSGSFGTTLDGFLRAGPISPKLLEAVVVPGDVAAGSAPIEVPQASLPGIQPVTPTTAPNSASGSGTTPLLREDAETIYVLQQLRSALAARACLGLLDWWLLCLLDLAFKASRSREWWARQARRPFRHFLWRGPSRWFGASLAEHDPPMPAVALARLHVLQSHHASQVGALRHCLSELNHSGSIDAIGEVAFKALHNLQELIEAYLQPEQPIQHPQLDAPPNNIHMGSIPLEQHDAAPSGAPATAPVRAPACISSTPEVAAQLPLPVAQQALPQAEGRSLALLASLRVVAQRSISAREAAYRKLRSFAYPTHVQRHWLGYSCAAVVGATIALYLSRRSVAIVPLLRRSAKEAAIAATSFLKEHVYTPAALIVKELYKPQYQRVSDPREISEADALLRSLLRQFKENWSSELNALVAAGGGSAAAASAVASIAVPEATEELEADIDDGLVNYGGAKSTRSQNDSQCSLQAANKTSYGEDHPHGEQVPYTSKDGTGLLGTLSSAVGAVGGAVGAVGEAANLRRWTSSGTLPKASPGLTDTLPPEQAQAAELEAMSRLFAQQMQSPAYNMARGPLLQLLLIQTQYMRREILLQMGAMDTLMAQNYLTATISAMLPGAMALAVLIAALRRLVRRLRSRRRSRASLLKQIRSVLRDAERLLLRALASNCKQLSQIDLGLLVISMHAMRQTVLRHRVLLSAGERHNLFEDCADLESDLYDVSQKLLIMQRIYRTQPALLAAGPPGRTRHDELGSGMQTVGDSLSRGSASNLLRIAPAAFSPRVVATKPTGPTD